MGGSSFFRLLGTEWRRRGTRSARNRVASSHGFMFALAFAARGISSSAAFIHITGGGGGGRGGGESTTTNAWMMRTSTHLALPYDRYCGGGVGGGALLPHQRAFLSRRNDNNHARRLLSSRLFSSTSSSAAAAAGEGGDAGRSEAERIMTEDAIAIVNKAIEAVDPYSAIRNYVRVVLNPDTNTNELHVGSSSSSSSSNDDKVVYNLDDDFDTIVLVAFGKASSAMGTAVLQQLNIGSTNDNNENIDIRGVIVVKDDHGTKSEREYLESSGVRFREASHPVPDSRSTTAAKEIMDVISETANPRTLVICCISGGGSALFCLPQQQSLDSSITLEDLQATNSVLLSSGLDIKEMNIIRKRLEDGKGGRLAEAAYPSTVCSLVLSDVLGDPLDLIASGPTVPDTSTFDDAWQLVVKNDLQTKLPKNIVQILKDGVDGKIPDSPSADHPIFSTQGLCETVVVGNNELAVEAAAEEAERRGYDAKVLGTRVEGEAKHASNFYAAMAQQLCLQQQQGQGQKQPAGSSTRRPYSLAQLPAALIAGGETTVSIPADSNGKGGRNQELALAAAVEFHDLRLRDVVLASVGTDGTDGPTDAAGAVVDGGTIERLQGSAEDALRRHDAYTYLDQKESDDQHTPLIKTGPTGTNVADVCVLLVR